MRENPRAMEKENLTENSKPVANPTKAKILANKLSKFAKFVFLLCLLYLIFSFSFRFVGYLSFAVTAMFITAFILYYYFKNDKSITALKNLLRNHYFKTKYLITKIENENLAIERTCELYYDKTKQKLEAKCSMRSKLKRKIKFIIFSAYFNILYFLIMITQNSEESFDILREEIQKKDGRVVNVTVKSGDKVEVINLDEITKGLWKGHSEDIKVADQMIQKLFKLHHHKQKRAKIYSISSLAVIIIATTFSGLVTSLIFPHLFKSYAATYNFTQTDWRGGLTANNITHTDPPVSDWDEYSATSTGATITATTSLALIQNSYYATDDGTLSTDGSATGGGFLNGADSGTVVTAAGASSKIMLDDFSYPEGVIIDESVIVEGSCPSGYVEGTNCFHTLEDWEDAEDGAGARDLVIENAIAVARIDGAWASADADGDIEINGWTTGANNFIRIYTTAAARHDGKWNTGKYRIESTNSNTLYIREQYVYAEGLQLKITSTIGSRHGVEVNTSSPSDVSVSECIIKGDVSGEITYNWGIVFNPNVANQIGRVFNNIIYGFTTSGSAGIRFNYPEATSSGYFYNNTIYNCTNGIMANSSSIKYVKNNAIFVTTGAAFSSTFQSESTNNISSDGSAPPYGTYYTNYTATSTPNPGTGDWVIFTNLTSGSEDFHLVSDAENTALNTGYDLSGDGAIPFNYDIDGTTRGTSWDIGADEYGGTAYLSSGTFTSATINLGASASLDSFSWSPLSQITNTGIDMQVAKSESSEGPWYYKPVQNSAIAIYRSVGPGATSALATGATYGALTISGTTATFASDLPLNIGVGDVIKYDSGGTQVAFIHGRKSANVYTVKSASGGTPTAVSSYSGWNIYRAYTSLYYAEAGTENTGIGVNFDTWTGGRDLVINNEQWNIACYAGYDNAADTTAVTIGGWTTGRTNYLRIYTPYLTSEVGTSQRHNGKWNTAYYYLSKTATSETNFITLTSYYIYLEGLQIYLDNAGFNFCRALYFPSSSSNYYINSCIIKGNNGSGILYGIAADSPAFSIKNSIIYNIPYMCISTRGSGKIYNTIVKNCQYGIRPEGNTSPPLVKNSLAFSCTDGYYGTFDSSSDYNMSTNSATDAPNATFTNDYITQSATDFFADYENDDFHIKTGSVAKNAGTNLSTDTYLDFSTDIDGTYRADGSWDIGADEYSGTERSSSGQYIQYKAKLSTTDVSATASLEDLTINYSHYPTSSYLVSSPYDTSSSGNLVGGIGWSDSLPANTQLSFYLRATSSSANLATTNWIEVASTTSSFLTSGCSRSGSVDCPVEVIPLALSSGTLDRRWIQYKVDLISNGAYTPYLHDITLTYVVNAAPSFNPDYPSVSDGGVSGTQISDSEDAKYGQVKVMYSIKDEDGSTGNEATRNYITPTFEYSTNGVAFTSISTSTIVFGTAPENGEVADHNSDGDIDHKVLEDGYLIYTAYWDAPTYLSSVYYPAFRIRVTIDDNEAANHTATVSSNSFVLDTTDPASPSISVVASTTPATVNLSITEPSTAYMKISLLDDVSDASWQNFNSTSTITLASDPDTVYARFKDLYGNTTTIVNAATPETPVYMIIKDLSNPDTSDYKLFIAWKISEEADFASYHLWQSIDGNSYSHLTAITPETTNYHIHSGVNSANTYYYKVATKDDASNISYFSSVVYDQPDGQGGTDTTAPTISNVATSSVSTTQAVVTWNTNELATSTVGYSTTSGLFSTEITVNSMVDNSSGVGAHTIGLTGLTPNTRYYFQVASTDPSGNMTTDNNGGDGYTFVTAPGANFTSHPQASNIDNISATIEWTTDINSDSYVVYSLSSNMSNSTQVGSATFATDHSVNLTGLSVATKYYYFVKSTDAEENLATDNNGGEYYSFTTTYDTTAPIITFATSTDITSITSSSALIKWTTDEPATSTVAYGLTANSYTWSTNSNTLNYSHIIPLSGLTDSSTYYFKLISTDANGNTATDNNSGADYSFTTLDDTGPVISSVNAGNTTLSSAEISWFTNEPSDSFAQYSLSTSTFSTTCIEKGSSNASTTHTVELTGLTEYTTYYYSVKSEDSLNNSTTDNNNGAYHTFITLRDSTAPVVSNAGASSIKDTSALITWLTDERANSIVEYGTQSLAYTTSTTTSSNLNLNHASLITALLPATKYYYRAVSKDANANQGVSAEKSFTTLETLYEQTEVDELEETARGQGEANAQQSATGGGILIIDKTDKIPPAISNISVSDITTDSAVVSWRTNELSNGFVEYGKNTDYGHVTSNRNINTLTHSTLLSWLDPDTTYHYRILAVDSWGNWAQSDDQTFTADKKLSEEKKLFEQIEDLAEVKDNKSAEDLFVNAAIAAQKAMSIIEELSTKVSINRVEKTFSTQLENWKKMASVIPPPLMSGEPKVITTATTAMIAWRTDKESNSLVAIASDGLFNIAKDKENPYSQIVGEPNDLTTAHVVTVYDLEPDTTYHYQVRSQAPLGPMAKSPDFTFKTKTETLEITNYAVQNISNEKAIFKWVTNMETDSMVKYIPYRDNKLIVEEAKEAANSAMSIIHEIEIDNFEAGVIYNIILSGKDLNKNIAEKEIPAFSTANDDLPPIIYQAQTDSALSPGKDAKVQTIISWLTNEPATGRVFYMKGIGNNAEDFNEQTAMDNNFSKKHISVITKFDAGAVYSFRVESVDSGGNVALSKIYTILTPRQKESVFQLIMKNFEKTFGWVSKLKQ
ncbi:MAG: fibronectin type III domain-containing protein [bacterium]